MGKKSGFTLAEVLITLGIIGVVAALTIPILIANYQKTQYVTQLKKAYSQFNQALSLFATDQGCIGDLACTNFFENGSTTQDFGDEFVKYFKILKNCELNDSQGCMNDSSHNTFDGSGPISYLDQENLMYKFVIADGTSFEIRTFDSCYAGGLNNLSQRCGYVYIDVNGPGKGPNCMGRDIFSFEITNGKGPAIYPTGGADDSDMMMGSQYWKDTGSCTESNPNGNKCAARIIDEGWKMNY